MDAKETYGQTEKKDALMQYLVREPRIKNGKAPLLLLLHGVGSNEKDLFSFANLLPDQFLVVSARGPYTLEPGRYAWYQVDFSTGKPVIQIEQEERSRRIILQFIEELKERYLIEEGAVFLCGFSQGAIMSYSAGLTAPHLIKGIAAMSGRLLEEVKPMIATTEKLKRLRVFISHGIEDRMLNIEYARSCDSYLKSLGVQTDCKEYHEGHGINREMLADLIAWLTNPG